VSAVATSARGLLINGVERPADDDASFVVLDPAYGQVIAEVANATVRDALDAVGAAADAGPSWAERPPRERGEVLRRAFELMRDRGEQIAELIVRENGKPLVDARAEVAYAAEFFRWYSEEAVRLLGTVSTAPSGTNRILVLHEPVGVCVLITPWNFPAAMAARKIAPALAAGCGVVLKPASDTPLTALWLADLLAEAGVPDGLVNVLPSRRSGEIVGAMLGDPRVRKLSFTGSTEVGRTLLAAASASVINTSMELGGNAPFLVLEDADLDAAVEGALVAKMRNVGQACTAANRLVVHQSIADEFAERLVTAMAELPVGPGLRENVRVGPLVNEQAREKIDELLTDARDRDARVRLGGQRLEGPGYFYAPTVLDVADPGSLILGAEIFGPVAPIQRFASDDEAIELANRTEYGLVAYVYSRDLRRALRVGRGVEAGMIGINRGLVSDPAAPFGGVKQSGIGREGGHEGLLDYTESKYYAISDY
jgi:succinate-semialdehyde dehydrogenase/glutarate-semialdehyde dehydrogenase